MRKSRRVFVYAVLLAASAGFVFWGCSEDLSSNCDVTTGVCQDESSNTSTETSSSSYNNTGNSSSSSGGSTTPSSSSRNSSSSSSSGGSTTTSSSSNTSTPSSSSVASTPGNGAPGNCAAPDYGVPPYGAGSCVKASNGKCYTCNPDRGADCNQGWIFQLGNPTDAYWFKEVSCGSTTNPSSSSQTSNQSSSGTTNQSSSSPNLTCATVSQSITVGQIPSPPAVGCGSTTLNISQLTFTPNIKSAITSAQTINNLQVSATCGGSTKTASCPGTITVTAVPSSSSASGGGTGCSECSQTLTQGASGVKTAKTTRYWDSCKPSCAWTGNASQSPNGAAMTCNVSGSKLSDQNAKNACESGGSGYTCANQFPWAVNDNLAYGFAASHSNGDCGKCFLLQFTSNGEGGMSGTISGKKMVVIVSNIGGDVGGDQYDLMIPGGGVGLYNAFSSQISSNGGPNSPSLGQQYGGFRATCGNDVNCIRNMCTAAFGSGSSGVRGDFMKGCEWYINWFGISNNPTVLSKQITCPPELVSKYRH